ncbi:MAG: hypothetical protein J6K32_02250 [Clostridia bacterium]|nr:hypothetical protein [Clostridia bacterium]
MMQHSYSTDVIRLAGKVTSEAVLRRVYKILDREYEKQGARMNNEASSLASHGRHHEAESK